MKRTALFLFLLLPLALTSKAQHPARKFIADTPVGEAEATSEAEPDLAFRGEKVSTLRHPAPLRVLSLSDLKIVKPSFGKVRRSRWISATERTFRRPRPLPEAPGPARGSLWTSFAWSLAQV